MKKYICIGVTVVFTLLLIAMSSPFKMFIDIPTAIAVLGIGGIGAYLVPEKGANNFIHAGWLVFGIGLVAGMYHLNPTDGIEQMGANLSVSSIAMVYAYLAGILFDFSKAKS